jgi:hypothetical protein
MNEKLSELLVHMACVVIIGGCFALAELTPLHTVLIGGMAVFSRSLEVAGFFLWGKLGFKPAEAIMTKLLLQMEPEKVERIMSQRPPPPLSEPRLVVSASVAPAPADRDV